jgi:hypothetical protein
MRLIAVAVWLIAMSEPARSSELTRAVLDSNDLIDIYPKLKGTRYQVVTVEQVPDKLFEIILGGKATDEEWKALSHYSNLTDAGASVDFMHSCFNALKRNPMIFYDRFMRGDKTALQWMRDALGDDFAAYETLTEASYEEHERFYERSLRNIDDKRVKLSREGLKKHEEFMNDSRRHFKDWRIRYREKFQ